MKKKKNRNRGERLTPTETKKVIKLLMSGETSAEISRTLGVTRQTIYAIKKREGIDGILEGDQDRGNAKKHWEKNLDLVIEEQSLLEKRVKSSKNKELSTRNTEDVIDDLSNVTDVELYQLVKQIKSLPDEKMPELLRALDTRFQLAATITSAAKITAVMIRKTITEKYNKHTTLKPKELRDLMSTLDIISELVKKVEGTDDQTARVIHKVVFERE